MQSEELDQEEEELLTMTFLGEKGGREGKRGEGAEGLLDEEREGKINKERK